MKKDCNVIKDLLPLYIDDVCSNESRELVEKHLRNCNNCQKYLDELKFDIKESKVDEINVFKKFAKKINFKIIINTIIISCFVLAITLGILYFSGHYYFTSNYSKKMNIIIHEDSKDWSLQFMTPTWGRHFGTAITYNENGEDTNIIFITHKHTIQDYFESEKDGSYGTEIKGLNFQDINPKDNMKVYYTTEDIDNIKDANEEELKSIINKSTLIFTKEKTNSTINCTLKNKNYSYTLTYYEVNKQIVESIGDMEMPEDLLMHIMSIHGDYDSIWFHGDKATDTFKKIEDFMANKGGTCKLDTNGI